MKLISSELQKDLIDRFKTNLAELFFFNNAVVVEMFEGVHVDCTSSEETFMIIKDFFDGKPFGYISNRVNNYSVSPLDYPKMYNHFDNMEMFCIVHHHQFDKMNFNVEKHFMNKSIFSFDNLYTAFSTVENLISSKLAENKIYVKNK